MAGTNLRPGTIIGEISADNMFEWDGVTWNTRRVNIDNPIPRIITIADVTVGNVPAASSLVVAVSGTGTRYTDLNGNSFTGPVNWIQYQYEGDSYFRIIRADGTSILSMNVPT